MKKQLLIILMPVIFGINMNAQTEPCGTMQNLENKIKIDPALKEKMEASEKRTQEWLKNNSRTKSPNVIKSNDNKSLRSVMSLCGFDNAYFTTIVAPSVINQKVSPSPNCTYGGEYVQVTGLVAGNVYRISTCGVNNFDTQLSVYTAGGGQAVAFNDDWCASQSEIYFNPRTSGSYDILIDEYGCLSNSLCASLEVELFYIPRPVITIPVVVHVIHYGESIGTGRNISNAEIQSQINVLNEDYRRFNSDINSTPAAFRGVSDDALIEFCLAQQDEFGNPTTGIDRILGSQAAYSNSDMEIFVKPSTYWDATQYLNVWTCDLTGGLLGYAQFPAQLATSPQTDGVVIKYSSFGTISSASPYDLGRTSTHEVGHWLNMRHIWGDESACAADDFVDDTPLEGDKNFGIPTFPLTDACSPNYPGIMFYNYMDYCDDISLSMFTFGQTSRMDATLFNERIGLQTSVGCNAPTLGIIESAFANSIKVYPNPSVGYFTIQMNDKLKTAELKITDAIGKMILSQSLVNNFEEINLSEYPNGIYFISISSTYGVVNKKLILNR